MPTIPHHSRYAVLPKRVLLPGWNNSGPASMPCWVLLSYRRYRSYRLPSWYVPAERWQLHMHAMPSRWVLRLGYHHPSAVPHWLLLPSWNFGCNLASLPFGHLQELHRWPIRVGLQRLYTWYVLWICWVDLALRTL
jgi:hypothetical protein